MTQSAELQQLAAVFRAGLDRVDPYQMIVDHVRVVDEHLLVAFDDQRFDLDLGQFSRILVLGAGKASAAMARAIEDVLGGRISAGLVVVKYGHSEKLNRIEVVEAGHPTPDDNGVRAAERIALMARRADAATLVLTVISGGGSALLCAPLAVDDGTLSARLTLADKQATTQALLACGAEIGEINCVRKHLSRLKGGRLLQLLAPARSFNFILSDVVGDRLDTIASGLTAYDPTSYQDALAIVAHYAIEPKIPAAVMQMLRWGAQGAIAETLKEGDPAGAGATNILIGSNLAALRAARDRARLFGYHTVALTASLTGEAREAAKFLYAIARDVRDRQLLSPTPALIIAGGETVVTVTGSGKGGRNQEMALAFLGELAKDEFRGRGLYFLSASTDGSDGPTDAAGAFASTELLDLADAAGLSIEASLRNNDSYGFFDQIGQLLRTGPTRTNVCDLHMVLVKPDAGRRHR